MNENKEKVNYEDIMNGELCIVKRTFKKTFMPDEVRTVVLARKLYGNGTVKIEPIADLIKDGEKYGLKLSGTFTSKTLYKLHDVLNNLETGVIKVIEE